MSLSATDTLPRRASARRWRVVLATAVAICAVGGLAGAAAADDRLSAFDVSTQVFTDSQGDSGAVPDLRSAQITYIENDPGTAADDQILFTTVVENDGQGARFSPGDRVIWYLDTDNDASTGGPGPVPPYSPIGAEYRIVLFGPAEGGLPDVELSRWNGAGWDFRRDLTSSEVVISEALGIVGLQVPRADVGAARGSMLALVEQTASVTPGVTDTDFAPNAPPRYTIAIPAAPTPPAVAPAATAAAAGRTTLTLSATVDPKGLPTTYRFQYGASTAYGSETTPGSAGSGQGATVVSSAVTGLTPGTTYNYRVIATNAAGVTVGPNLTATTTSLPPTAKTMDATVTGPRSAQLAAVVGTRGSQASVHFQWGRKAGELTSRTATQKVTGDGIGVRATLRGLRPNRRYHYRIVVESAGGRADGAVRSFLARQTRVLADVAVAAGPSTPSRTSLRALDATVRAVSLTTGRPVRASTALRSARVTVSCARGCRLSQAFSLSARSARLTHIAAPRGSFWGTASRAVGGSVNVAIPKPGRRISLDLAPLFTDGRGHPYLSPSGSVILVRVTGPGLVPSATRISVGPGVQTRRCALSGGRTVACRPL